MNLINQRSLEDYLRMPPESIGDVNSIELQADGALCANVEPRRAEVLGRLQIIYRGDGVVGINDGARMVNYDDHGYYCRNIPVANRLAVMLKRYLESRCA